MARKNTMPSKLLFDRNDKPLCWVIKTTKGGPGETGEGDYWPQFARDGVVAVGWASIEEDPSDFDDYESFLTELRTNYSWEVNNVGHVVSTIFCFARCWQEQDVAVICEGYAPNQESKDILVHGVAAIVGRFRVDPKPKWEWRFKRKAIITQLQVRVPKQVFIDAFERKSMLQTIHGPFTLRQFDTFCKGVRRSYPGLKL